MFKVIIAGSRDFNNYNLLKEKCDYQLQNIKEEIIIVSGTARGADKLGERYAKEKGYKIDPHPANWDFHGKSAGYIRNEEMAKCSDALIACWDGKSKGTKHMIDLANKYGLKVCIVKF
ncbi:MAG: DUF2493 domain-containing protein [Bacilli bacterium]|nr:DUF2493 domain-containing protein [Bacilli bacterium]